MENLVADAARFDVFRLIDAAMNGQGAQVSRMLRGLRGEGEAVPALLGMVIKELQTAAALARAGNLANAFKAQRIWDSKQPMYRRALQRHEAKRWDALPRPGRPRRWHRQGAAALGSGAGRCLDRAGASAAGRGRAAGDAPAGRACVTLKSATVEGCLKAHAT